MRHEGTLNFERSDTVTGALDNVIVSSYEPDIALRISPCCIACTVVSTGPLFSHCFRILIVLTEESDRLCRCVLDNDVAYDTVFYRNTVVVKKLDVVDRRRHACGTRLYIDPGEVCEKNASFCLAESFADLKTCVFLPLVEYFRIQRLACH